jgi:hypothetical protein
MADPTPVGGRFAWVNPEAAITAVVFTGTDADADPVELARWTVGR